MLCESGNGAKNRPRRLALGDFYAEALFDAHGQLEGIEGVEAQPIAEEGCVIDDAGRIPAHELELGNNQLFDFLTKLLAGHTDTLHPSAAHAKVPEALVGGVSKGYAMVPR